MGVVVLAVVVLGACGSDSDGVDDGATVFTDDGTHFVLEPGDQFTIVLESNATTGYGWELSEVPPREVVVLVDDVYVAPDTDLVGAPGYQELTFEAVGDGSTFLQLWYVRAFDDPPDPDQRAQFELTVGSGVSDDTTPSEGDDPQSTIPDDENAVSVDEALAFETGRPATVRGSLFDDGSGLVLCGALAESFPPQCPGPSLLIVNPEVVDVDLTSEGGVSWTDRVVVAVGTITDGGIEISDVG